MKGTLRIHPLLTRTGLLFAATWLLGGQAAHARGTGRGLGRLMSALLDGDPSSIDVQGVLAALVFVVGCVLVTVAVANRHSAFERLGFVVAAFGREGARAVVGLLGTYMAVGASTYPLWGTIGGPTGRHGEPLAMFGGPMMSIPNIGGAMELAALLFAAVGFSTGVYAGTTRSPKAWQWTRISAYGFAGTMIAANLLMVYALVTHDFSVRYVAEVGSRSTPTYFTIVSLWASLNGSILFWGAILGLYTAGMVYSLGDKHREYAPWALAVQMATAIFFAFMVASIANPFSPVIPAPLDGPGPNPLLQNHWLMAVHPPMLYLGYVGMSVPFSLICAALLTGRLEAGWVAPMRFWMLVPWTFLSVGIVLGGWWSYAVLGWGGAWAWDPVENASFHPWLTGTAFLHSAMVLQRRGRLRDWTLLLGMSTFLLTLIGTFMTRSGVFNSVHSFTQSDIGPIFLWFIAATLTLSLVLLTFRAHKLDEAAAETDKRLGAGRKAASMNILSREGAILAQNALFAAFTFTVLFGTIYPLFVEYWQERRISVGEPYFDKWALPLGVALVFMMGVGPLLPWGRLPGDKAAKRIVAPVVSGLVFAGITAAAGFTGPQTLLALFVSGFAFWANFNEILEPTVQRIRVHGFQMEPQYMGVGAGILVVGALVTYAGQTFMADSADSKIFLGLLFTVLGAGICVVAIQQFIRGIVPLWKVVLRGRRRFGGHIAHYGVLMAVISLALTKGYRVESDFPMTKGESIEFQGYDIRYDGAEMVKEEHRQALVTSFALSRSGDEIGVYQPRMNFYATQREPIYTPDNHSRPWGDLYFSIISVPGDGASAVLRLIWQPFQVWLWLSAPMILLGSLIAAWPERRKTRTAREEAAPAAQAGAAK